MTAKPGADDWGLWVNECGIFASGIGADRWAGFTLRANDGRLTTLSMGPGGGEWHVMCGTRKAAHECRETFLDVGFHRAHIRVARLSACLAKAGERTRRHGGRAAMVAGGPVAEVSRPAAGPSRARPQVSGPLPAPTAPAGRQ